MTRQTAVNVETNVTLVKYAASVHARRVWETRIAMGKALLFTMTPQTADSAKTNAMWGKDVPKEHVSQALVIHIVMVN